MHKFFAKTQFLGKIIKILPECHSTNSLLQELSGKERLQEGCLLITDFQTQGRGQRGNEWISNPGENLLMSILLKPSFLEIQDQHFLNIITSLAICDTLKTEIKTEIKWPNDIYSGNQKICGILVENTLSGHKIESSILGLGLNVFQRDFANQAASLASLGSDLDKWSFLESFLPHLESYYNVLRSGELENFQRVDKCLRIGHFKVFILIKLFLRKSSKASKA